jgi:hypothetical protein
MTKKLLFAGTILMLVVCVAVAADAISGKWTYEMPGRGGGGGGGGTPRVVTLDLKVAGATLTGTILQPMGGRGMGGGGGAPGGAAAGGAPPAPTPTPIANGKVNGNTITFDVVRDMGGQSMTTKYEGTVNGDALHLKITRPDMGNGPTPPQEVDAKRATT